MALKGKIDFKNTSLTIFAVYAVCIAFLLLNGVSKKHIDYVWELQAWQLTSLFMIWLLLISPQFILLLYVLKFKTRWAQLTSLILQIIAFILPMYHHGEMLLSMHYEHQPLEMLLSIPIWECVIILALGLIFKLIKNY